MSKKLIALSAGGVFLVLALVTWFVFLPQSVLSEGNKLEADLSGQYTITAITLHKCVTNTASAAQVANAYTDALSRVLKDAVGGRYGTGNEMDKAKLFSAIQEAYPDTSGATKIYEKALVTITNCQGEFAGQQKVVAQWVNNFRSWKTDSWRVRNFGGDNFPNENLVVNVPGMPVLAGAAALLHIAKPVIDTDTSNAISSGIEDSHKKNPFSPSTNPSPASTATPSSSPTR